MWKRLNNPKGAPAQLDTTLDRRYRGPASGLGIITPVQSPPDPPPPRPPRDGMAPKNLPQLPFEPDLPPPPSFRDSTYRPVSSIYSQPSPNAPTSRFLRTAYAYPSNSYTEEEVSPPSSPEFDGRYHSSQYQGNDDEVSPIDEMPDISRIAFDTSNSQRPNSSSRPSSSSKPPPSNIPILRREKRHNQVAAAAANLVTRKHVGVQGQPNGRMTVDPRWDPYSGEITTSDKGKPQSVKPGAFVPPGLRPTHKETGLPLGNQSSISAAPVAKNHSSFGDRVRKLKMNNPLPMERPEWKGATGRQAIVAPVADNYDIPPISIPPKDIRRVVSPQIPASTSPVSVVRYPYHEDQTNPAADLDPAIPTIFSNSGRSSPYATQSYTQSPISITPDPVVVDQSAAARTLTRGSPTPATPEPQHQKKDPVGAIERNFLESLKEVNVPAVDSDPYVQPLSRFSVTTYAPSEAQGTPYVQPPSRFSITTYAPSEAQSTPYVQPPSRFSVTTYAPSEAQSPPRPSYDFDRPPIPKIPAPPQPGPEAQSVLDRKRPKVWASPPSTVVQRKAVNVNPGSPVFTNMTSSIVSKRSTNKNLPMTPSESESHDLVTSLQAQLDALAHRRNNITRSIKQMTELMPKDHVMLTEDVRKKREIEKRKVEQLKIEEADVIREEHDIGLRLHRAWKRRDKDSIYEPTGLWVRRVTG